MNGTALLVLAAFTAGAVIGRLSADRWSGPVDVPTEFQYRKPAPETVVNLSGSLDPVAVARQINDLLGGRDGRAEGGQR